MGPYLCGARTAVPGQLPSSQMKIGIVPISTWLGGCFPAAGTAFSILHSTGLIQATLATSAWADQEQIARSQGLHVPSSTLVNVLFF